MSEMELRRVAVVGINKLVLALPQKINAKLFWTFRCHKHTKVNYFY